MKDYRRGAHTVFEIHLHLLWVTKYRKPVMTGEVGTRLRELIREIYGNQGITIIKEHISKLRGIFLARPLSEMSLDGSFTKQRSRLAKM